MKISLENVNLGSNSGPNSFARKLINNLDKAEHEIVDIQHSDVNLCFIESYRSEINSKPTFQRLDGIYFNSDQNYKSQNNNIARTYNQAKGVIFQSEFNKRLIFEWFGAHDNYEIIHNGADLEVIKDIPALSGKIVEKYENIWTCAALWRPHKRLKDNIRYFLEHSSERDCLLVAGANSDNTIKHPRVKFLGPLKPEYLISIYKASTYFIHLAWLDHCPNVVIDARACGCKVICSSTGGTKEIAGPNATIIQEDEWDLKPTKLYQPPEIKFDKKLDNHLNSCYHMKKVTERYIQFFSK